MKLKVSTARMSMKKGAGETRTYRRSPEMTARAIMKVP
jgi:hypothetical protein